MVVSINIHSKIQVEPLYSSNRPKVTSFAPLVADGVETVLVVVVPLELVVVVAVPPLPLPLESVLVLPSLSVLLPLPSSLE
jgi:hypothetical protein